MASCSICMDSFTAALRKQTDCPYCEVPICRACLQTCLLMDNAAEPVCPSCRAAWSREFLNDQLTAAFRNGPFKKYREKVLVDRERARLPETQEQAAAYKVAVEFLKPIDEKIAVIRAKMDKLPSKKAADAARAAYYESRTGKVYNDWLAKATILMKAMQDTRIANMKEEKPLKKQIKALNKDTRTHRHTRSSFGIIYVPHTQAQLNAIVHQALHGGPAPVVEEKKKAVFIQKCPATTCEGFLSTQWICGLCNIKVCKDCHEPKAATGHTCNPDLVESVKAIKKEAKPCPKCASQISKIDGCDQMWCTQCHTAFSWRTGEIETHVVHNPHYFQWMREQGSGAVPRAPGDVPQPCGGVRAIFARLVQGMLWSEVPADNTVLPPAKFQDETIYCRLTHYIQLLQHIQHYELPLCRQGIDDASWEEARRRFRVQRMVGLISSHTRLRLKMQKEEASVNMDDNWKHELVLLENRVLRARAKVQLMDMYTTAGMDIIGQILEGDVTEEKVKSIYGQFGA